MTQELHLAKEQLNLLSEVIGGMKEEQQSNAKFTERQLSKVNDQLNSMKESQSMQNYKSTMNAVASIGTNLQSQAGNLKSGDPIRISAGVLSLVSGVAMCFGPVGMAVGAVTGLVGGVLSMFAGTPKPTMTEIIGNMIQQQTEQIAKMVESLAKHIDTQFEAISKQISDSFMKLAKDLQIEFIKQKQFNEQLVAKTESAGAVAILLENISFLTGFVEGFDENAKENKINTQITRLLSQITAKDGIKEIGITKAMIEEKLGQLKEVLNMNEKDKETNEAAYWLLHNYTIQMIVSLINIYVTLNTYRYMILFQLSCLLDVAKDKANSSAMRKVMDVLKAEGAELLQFIAKPSPDKQYEFIISGYIRKSLTAKNIDEYLKFCTSNVKGYEIDRSKQISLSDSIPSFNANNLYAIQSLANPNNILVTGGVVDETTFIRNAASIAYDASINNYSLYYQLEQDKEEPWKINLKGSSITYIASTNQIHLMKKITVDYPQSLLLAISSSPPTDSDEKKDDDQLATSTSFMLLTIDDPGSLLKIKDEKKEEKPKSDNNSRQLSLSLVSPFERTRNLITNNAWYKLSKPKASISNAMDIIPKSDQTLEKGEPDIVPPIEDPKYEVITKEVALKIRNANNAILTKILKQYDNNGVDGVHFAALFNKNNNTNSGKALAVPIQDTAINLIRATSIMRRSGQLVYEILAHSPAIDESTANGKKQKKYWDIIKSSCKIIIASITETLVAGAEFWNFLTRFSQSFQKFITDQSDDSGAKDDIGAVEEWLKNAVKLPEYFDILKKNGLTSLEIIKMSITDKSVLKEIGITMMGHQIAIMNAINKLGGSGGGVDDETKEEEKKQSLALSIKWLNDDLKEFNEFAAEYRKKTNEIQTAINKAVTELVEETIGDKGIKEKQENLITKQNAYNIKLGLLLQQQKLRDTELNPLYSKKYNLESAIATDQVFVDYYDGQITNYDLAIKNAQKSVDKLNDQLRLNPTDVETTQELRYYVFYAKTETKTITTNRHKNLKKDQQHLEQLMADKAGNQEKIMEKMKPIRTRLDANRKYLEETDRKIQLAEHKWKLALTTPKGDVDRTLTDWNNAQTQITEAIKQTGQSQTDLVDFLSLTQDLSPATTQTIQASQYLEGSINNVVKIWRRQCALSISIDDYFIAAQIFGDYKINDTVITALKEAGYINMIDMDYSGDNDSNSYKTDIEDGIFVAKKLNITNTQKNKIKKGATNPKETWIPNNQKPREREIRAILLESFPILLEYVSYMKTVIINANDQLAIERFNEESDKERLQKIDQIKPLPAIELSGPIITEIED